MAENVHLCWVNRAEGDLVFHVRGSMTLGRAPENEIVVDEDGISRRHCRLEVRDGELFVADLGSTNGTFVNGARVREQRLASGDNMLVGRALFEVRGERSGAVQPRTVLVGAETIQVALRAAEAHDPAHLRPAERVAQHLRTLCAVIEIINEGGSPDRLYERTLHTLARQLGAADAALILGTDAAARPAAVHPSTSSRAPSRTVLARVLASGEAILANDPAADAALGAAQSLVAARESNILCAPVPHQGRVIGALYLASAANATPWNEADLRLVSIVAHALGLAAENLHRQEVARAEHAALRAQIAGEPHIVGESAPLQRVIDMAARAAKAEVTVLLTGETGTGKELFARAIHAWSPRAAQPFIAINCGAIPATIVESELFGHEKGAFTGAVERRIGRFEMAERGTLFLDEIGELPLELQVKLLRVLEEKRFHRVGGALELRADVRIVAATNRDLEEQVQQGRFREDLLYRIRVLEIRVPPLRERRDDIIVLARHLLARLAAAVGRAPPVLTADATQRLREYAWPGNVRELRNVLERALILGASDTMDADDVLPGPLAAGRGAMERGSGELVPLKDIEREHIRSVLVATGWNKSKAAEILGIGRTNIYEKIKQYDLRSEDE